MFFASLQETLTRAEQALADGDWPVMEKQGHTIKGTAASYGFHALSSLGGALEFAAGEKDDGKAGELLAQLRSISNRQRIEFV